MNTTHIVLFIIMGLIVSSIVGKLKGSKGSDLVTVQGGMKFKYSELIGFIEQLSVEMFTTRDIPPNLKELNHTFRSFQKAPNKYLIEISFKRKGQLFMSKDSFTLHQVSYEELVIIYYRKSEHLISHLKPVLPKDVVKKFYFSSRRLSQKEIFESLLKGIIEMYSKTYNFSDLHFKKMHENLIE